ncbi:MAG TPA: SGNH/GDSL hydrolase family protein [Ideonella sp.]|nr:SGNH/GDSL hydrolase family protein [Ideonella sp.]
MTFPPLASRLLRGLVAAMMATGLLASCGGGTQVDEFSPARLLAFGDEHSLLTADGKKYSTNFVSDAEGLQCEEAPIWIQELADHYNMVFPQCNPDNAASPEAQTLATVGATVDDFSAQVQAFTASGSLTDSDMVTVLVGMHDVLDAYARYPAESEAVLTGEVQAAGRRLAAQVNAITDTGARVLISTIPDVGLTPFAIAETAANTDTDRGDLLTRLVDAFNRAMRLDLLNDGSKIGLLLADDLTRAAVRVPGAFGLGNTTVPVCAVALPDCTNKTVITDGNVETYLWADNLHWAESMQEQLGNQAVSRVNNNPF